MSTHQLKHFQTQRNEVEALYKNAKAKMVDAQREMEKYNLQMKNLDASISKLQNDIVISEHAYLRYFERVLGYDLEDVKNQIITAEVDQLIRQMGSGTYPTDTHKVRVKDNTVVTVLSLNEA